MLRRIIRIVATILSIILIADGIYGVFVTGTNDWGLIIIGSFFLIAKRDCLKQKIGIMRSFLNTASEKVSRYSKTEIRILSTISVSKLQKEVDGLSKELRETDETIQGLNWTTELL